MPGLRSRIAYWPELLVTAVRVFSISAGLDASTVTPGSSAPLVSRTVPAMELWAEAATGRAAVHVNAMRISTTRERMFVSSVEARGPGDNARKIPAGDVSYRPVGRYTSTSPSTRQPSDFAG